MSELITIMSMLRSLSSRRAWIEIANGPPATRHTGRSLSSRRAWIEIPWPTPTAPKPSSRSPHGERGLKFGRRRQEQRADRRRSPHGERGLKCWSDY